MIHVLHVIAIVGIDFRLARGQNVIGNTKQIREFNLTKNSDNVSHYGPSAQPAKEKVI
jgi:hypothetical protein